MLKTGHPEFIEGRALPLRNAHFFISESGALSLRTQIWFTPEVIIWDAFRVAGCLLYTWQLFRIAVRAFALRTIVIFSLIFFGVNLGNLPEDISATTLITKQGATSVKSNPYSLQITAAIRAEASPDFSWPVSNRDITSRFSWFHKGIDLPNPYSTPVKPLNSGEVVFANWDGGFGYSVIVRHDNHYSSRYAHLSNVAVKAGQRVERETVIGYIGASGFATGSHLHLEIYRDGVAIDPLKALR